MFFGPSIKRKFQDKPKSLAIINRISSSLVTQQNFNEKAQGFEILKIVFKQHGI